MSKDSWSLPAAGPWPAIPFGRRARFFETGEFRLAVLSLLAEGPKHGYHLMKEMTDRSGGFYKASAGSIYPTLQQLEDESLVKAVLLQGRRTYSLTAAGRKHLAADPEAVRRIWERAEEFEDWGHCMGPEAYAVYRPMIELFKTGLQTAGRVAAQRDGAERIRRILDRARRELEQL
jgi:DNA-binding PadR family transcriptional regulator